MFYGRRNLCLSRSFRFVLNGPFSILFIFFLFPLIRHYFPLLFGMTENPFDIVDNVVPYNFTLHFLLEPITLGNIELLVMVNCMSNDFKMREMIRISWANHQFVDRSTTKVIFLLGKNEDIEDTERLAIEEGKYHDIVVVDIPENYYTLSSKTYAMLYYKMTRFPDAKCLVKSDSDNILNLRNFERLCEEQIVVAPRIMGKCDIERRVKRDDPKWAVPISVYQKEHYPMYCSSGVYIFLGHDIPWRLISAAKQSKFASSENFRKLPEDVIFSGILSEEIGLVRKDIGGMSFIDVPQYLCRENLYTYSIHMNRKKDPIYYFKRLLSKEGIPCRR